MYIKCSQADECDELCFFKGRVNFVAAYNGPPDSAMAYAARIEEDGKYPYTCPEIGEEVVTLRKHVRAGHRAVECDFADEHCDGCVFASGSVPDFILRLYGPAKDGKYFKKCDTKNGLAVTITTIEQGHVVESIW